MSQRLVSLVVRAVWNDRFRKLRATKKAERLAAHKARQMATRVERNRCAEANIRTRKLGPRGEFGRRILAERTANGVERSYHVTKGWRVKAVLFGSVA